MATFNYEYGFIGPLSELQNEYCELAGMYSDAHKELNGSRWVPHFENEMTVEQNLEYLQYSYRRLCDEMAEEQAEEERYALDLLRKRAAHKRNATANAELRLKLSRAFSNAL